MQMQGRTSASKKARWLPSVSYFFCQNPSMDAVYRLPLYSVLILSLDNFEKLKGTPTSIQVFTTTMRDEECLQMAKQIDQCLKGSLTPVENSASKL